jgi:anti-sigma-K factor RskA
MSLRDLLHDYVAGDLDESNARAIRARIDREPKVRKLYEEIRETHAALLAMRERPEPPVSAEEVLPGIRAAIASNAFESRPQLLLEGTGTRFYRRLAIAATLLCAVTAGLLVLQGNDEPEPESLDRPTATERGLMPWDPDPFVEAGSRGSLDGFQYIQMLERHGKRATEVSFTPTDQVVPVFFGAPDQR